MNESIEVQAPGLSKGRFREATDVSNVCKEIVLATAVQIGARNYVCVEGWTSIAVAHGCIASVKEDSVREVRDPDGKLLGVRAIGEVKRQTDGFVLSSAEGFVGCDEIDWYGSHGESILRYNKQQGREVSAVVPKRADYAIRSMAQTRACSKVCRNAFSHIVVLMKAGLSTTPYEEVAGPEEQDPPAAEPPSSVQSERRPAADKPAEKAPPGTPVAGKTPTATGTVEVPRDEVTKLMEQFKEGGWRKVVVHFTAAHKGKKLGELEDNDLKWFCFKWTPRPWKGSISQDDMMLRAACNVAIDEENLQEPTR